MYDIKYITPDLGSVCGQYHRLLHNLSQRDSANCHSVLQWHPAWHCDIVTSLLRDIVTTMRVKYSQTPPPVVDEEAEGVRVTKQLTQVADY